MIGANTPSKYKYIYIYFFFTVFLWYNDDHHDFEDDNYDDDNVDGGNDHNKDNSKYIFFFIFDLGMPSIKNPRSVYY